MYCIFADVKGSGSVGFLSGLKSSECTVHQPHGQRGNIRLRAFHIWIVSRTASINHITPVLQQLLTDFEILLHTVKAVHYILLRTL